MPYKILACDLDETLLDHRHAIPKCNIDAIRRAKEEYSIKTVLATGRGYMTTQRELKTLDLYDKEGEYVLSYNGGCLTENKGNKRLQFSSLPYETVCRIADFAKDYDVGIHFYTVDMIYVYRLNEDERRRKESQGAVFCEIFDLDLAFLRDIPVAKIILQKVDMPYLQSIEPQLRPVLEDRCEITYSSGRFMEITAAGVNKGAGLRLLSAHLSIPLCEMIAVGDHLNDLPMLKAAGLAACPSNAADEVKAICDYVAKADHNEGAIAEILEKFVFMK